MKERRAMRRRHLMFHLRVFDATSGQPLGNLVDITPGGLMITGEQGLAPGERRRLRMHLPIEIFDKAELAFAATVAWSSDEVSPGLYDTGFRDLEMPDEDRSRLGALIDEYDLRDAG
ncbi:MAG: PilZ domain-containing protein [Halofilum sp. (in: g-proteobacteria)]|nr:PilZ domain-containing protein [Halofilum sp. (in: g-proteobacteria)]